MDDFAQAQNYSRFRNKHLIVYCDLFRLVDVKEPFHRSKLNYQHF